MPKHAIEDDQHLDEGRWVGEIRSVTIPHPPLLPLVVIDRMLFVLTHQSCLRTRATFSWPILYLKKRKGNSACTELCMGVCNVVIK